MAVSEIEHPSIFINTNQWDQQTVNQLWPGLKFLSSVGAATFALITTCFITIEQHVVYANAGKQQS